MNSRAPEEMTTLPNSTILKAYRAMLASRRFDDKEITLKQQNPVHFQASSAGHEAISVAVGLVVRPGYDWVFPHYRDRALCLFLGLTAREQFLASVAAGADGISCGRLMPSHWACRRFNMPSRSSCVGMQFLHAVRCAEAGYRCGLMPDSGLPIDFQPDEIVYVWRSNPTNRAWSAWGVVASNQDGRRQET